MEAFLLYIVKATICLTLFYIFVKALLTNETFFSFNRNILLIGSIVCFALPFIDIRLVETSVFQAPLIQLEEAITTSESYVIEKVENAEQPSNYVPARNSISWKIIIFSIYIAGLILNLLILSKSLFSMLGIIRRGKKFQRVEYTLVLIDDDISPFSYGHYLVMSEQDYNEHGREILIHELAHIRHHHSRDIIFMECMILLQWFNPAIWLLKRELKDVHEYQADMSVLQSGIDVTKYQLLLVKKAVGASSYTLANSFNHSKIKKRITMMLKEKSNKWARLKFLLLLPLGALSMYAFARPEAKLLSESLTVSEVTKLSGKNNGNIPAISLADTLPRNNVRGWSKEKNAEYLKRQGEPLVGHFKGMLFIKDATPGDPKTSIVTIYPVSYNKKGDGNEKNYIRIYYYVIDGKKYLSSKFVKICENGKVFFKKENIKPEDGKVIEVYGITDNGAETPVFYMVIP